MYDISLFIRGLSSLKWWIVVLGPYDPIDTGHAITLRSLILLFMIYDVLDSTRASCTSNGSLTPLQRNLIRAIAKLGIC